MTGPMDRGVSNLGGGPCSSTAGSSDLPDSTYLFVGCRWDPEVTYGTYDRTIRYRRWTGSAWNAWASLGAP